MTAAIGGDPEIPRYGVLAFGDSITNAGGEQWGVALQSWALWIARGLGLPYTGWAVDGAVAAHVVEAQIPAFLASSARPDARYDLGCLYIGVNDVRGPDWDPAGFAADHARALDFLAGRCDRLLAVTAPARLGRPPAGDRIDELATIVRRSAAAHGALLLDLGDFGARNHVMVDHVHPTALGQVAIARRALQVLSADGMRVRVDPATLIAPPAGRRDVLRADALYAGRTLRAGVAEAWRRRTAAGRAADRRDARRRG